MTTRRTKCFEGCGAWAVGHSAYCATCSAAITEGSKRRVRTVYDQSHPFRVGDRVRAERDETQYPARGSWFRYRGRVGTVVECNPTPGGTAPPEIGVVFGKVHRHHRTGSPQGKGVVWFQPHELVKVGQAAESQSDGLAPSPEGDPRPGEASQPSSAREPS